MKTSERQAGTANHANGSNHANANHATGSNHAIGRGSTSRRRLGRAATVVAAVVATTACFLAARAAGADFTITDPGQGKVPHTFVAVEIAMVTAVIGLLGWVTLAALERWTHRAAKIWAYLAVGIVFLSLVPIWIERATTQTRFSLAVVHGVVGVMLVPLVRFGRVGADPAPARR